MWKPENYGKNFMALLLQSWFREIKNLMTVRIAQNLGLEKNYKLFKKLKIYENPEELSLFL